MPSSPQFFRLLLQRNLEDGKLMIPKRFAKQHGRCFSSSVRLKVPDGKEWKVGVTTTPNGVVWLQQGWRQFTDHYSLEFGSLLVFKLLHGPSTFRTTIFDPTGLETEYYDSDRTTGRPFEYDDDEEEEEEEGSDSDEGSHSFPLLSKKRNKASVQPGTQSRKKIKVGNGDSVTIKTEPGEDECEPSLKKRVPRDRLSRREQRFANKAQAAQRWSSKSEKPCFKVAMKPSNVQRRFNLFIPRDFAEKYLSEDFGKIKLQTVNGRNWSLLYKWSRGDLAYISSGWKAFVQKNHLKEGDVGVFEMLKKDTFSFKLQDAPLSSPSTFPKKKASSTATNPFFEVNLCLRSHKKAILYIPMPFAKEHLSREMHSAAKLQVGNKQWIVTIKRYHNCVRFSAGWSSFYGDNALKDGDSCLFEMIDQRKCVFEVTVFRKV